jgi:glycosyltransferase involved in cell wall biosynthesis
MLMAQAIRRIHPPIAQKIIGQAPWVLFPEEEGPSAETDIRGRFAIPHQHRIILCPTRALSWRGVDVLLLALVELQATGHHFTALIAGDGPQRSEWEATAKTLGFQHAPDSNSVNVVFLGDDWPIRQLLEWTDLVVLPFRSRPDTGQMEGCGLAAIESALAARPLVLGNSGALEEHFSDGITALLVKPATDAQAYAQAIERLLRDDDLRRRIGSQAQATISQVLNSEAQTKRMAQVIDTIQQNRKPNSEEIGRAPIA